ncbi:hypothetical protein N8J30_004149 [Salmonella enterica subsp. enterica serovar Newport]|nr:hypothetical protein [Salmonella enterica subsp. enterica serovar Newport]EJW0497022.1 hypothetical protein [Salmonella enterica subsp. enterica serovar Newport]ELA5318517.1 hypothetical protein [Salmonella enterica subsp. enterica serovar Newport]
MTDAWATDDGLKLAKLVAYVDDGRDYTARIVWYMNRKRYIHEKRIVPMPPAPKVAAGSVEVKKPKVKRPRRKVTEV